MTSKSEEMVMVADLSDGATRRVLRPGDPRPEGLPPPWTYEGVLRRGHFPKMLKAYERGEFTPPDNEHDRSEYMREVKMLTKPLGLHVLGIRVEHDGALFFPMISVHPDYRDQGWMSLFLDYLPRHRTIVFPEVLTHTRLPGMLERRGFEKSLCNEDDYPVAYPVYARQPKGERSVAK